MLMQIIYVVEQCVSVYLEFKWLNQKEIDEFDVNSTEKDNSNGYILEVDLKYPNKLHALHNDYPLAPEKLEISHDMLSNYCSNVVNECGIKLVVWIN